MSNSPKLPPRNKRPKVPSQKGRTPVPGPIRVQNWGPSWYQRPAPVAVTPPAAASSGSGSSVAGTPPPIGVPLDATYYNDVGIAQRNRDTSVANLLTQRGATAQQYGYTPTYNEQGLISALAVDPNNPYAKANILQKSYQQARARNLNSFAARGQLYAGSLGVAQGLADEGYQQNSNALQNQFINFIARNQGQINAANTDYANSLANASSGAYGRAVQNDTGDYGYAPPAGSAPTVATPSSSSSGLARRARKTGYSLNRI